MDNRVPSTIVSINRKDDIIRKQYRAGGIAMFIVAMGLLLTRIGSGLIYSAGIIKNDDLYDFLTSFFFKVIILVVIVSLTYKLLLKMSFKELLSFSNFKKTKWYNYLLAIPIGVFGLFVTVGISSAWSVFIQLLGYTYSSSSTVYPEVFPVGEFLLAILTTGVFAGFCEEVAMRGGLFTVMNKSFSGVKFYLIMGIAFGLFHMYIPQLFYTACFGALMAYILKITKSIYPCIIVHFVNNSLSVYSDYALHYNMPLSGIVNMLNSALTTNFTVILLLYTLAVAGFIGLILLTRYLNITRKLKSKKEAILDSGFDHTNNRVVLVGEEDKEKVMELGLDKEVYGEKLQEEKFSPTLRDNVFYIGALAVSILMTISTFAFGLYY